MKTALKISLCLNLALLAGLAFMASRPNQRAGERVASPSGANREVSAPAAATAVLPAVQSTQPAPFRWSQLDAKDYHDYVKNLRAIGCPEITVRAIVTADVQAAYQALARQMEKQLSGLDHRRWPEQIAETQAASALKQRLSGLPDEAAAKIDDLLGVKAAPAQEVASSGASDPSETQDEPPIVAPVVFQDVDLAAMDLSEDQKQVIANIRQDFLKQIGGANQDPNDPAYLKRWQEAQPVADAQAQAMLGIEAYLDFQTKAGQKAMEKQARGLPAYQ